MSLQGPQIEEASGPSAAGPGAVPAPETEVQATRGRFGTGMRTGIPYAIAGLLVAISFGVLAQPVMGNVAPIVMSALMFAGAAQFAATAVLAAGGGAVAAIAAGILLNLRFGPMGVALAPSLRGDRMNRALTGQAMIDFSWAAASRGGGRFDAPFMVGATLPSYPAWVGGTAIGVFAGDLIGDPARLGLDALFPAFFLCLLVEGELRPGIPAVVAAVGAAVALVLIAFTPAGVPVIAASAAALLGLWRSGR